MIQTLIMRCLYEAIEAVSEGARQKCRAPCAIVRLPGSDYYADLRADDFAGDH